MVYISTKTGQQYIKPIDNTWVDTCVIIELTLGHLRYHLTDVPPQPNSPPDYVFRTDQTPRKTTLKLKLTVMQASVQRNK